MKSFWKKYIKKMSNNLGQQFQKIDELLKNARKILIASHQNPDPDAVASVLTFHYVFKKRNLASFPYLPDYPSSKLNFLPGFLEIKTEINSFEPDILFCLDYGDFRRLRLPPHLSTDNNRIITIDHHLESDQRGVVKILEPEFSSTAEILYHWLNYQNIEIDENIATCLLAGIFSDSGGFCHAATSAGTLNIVAELLLKGVSLVEITRQTLDFDRPLHLSQAWGQVLSRTQLDQRTGLAYSWLTIEDVEKLGCSLNDFDGIANLISTSSSLNLGLFLVEYEKGKVKGSLRSEPKGDKNVAEIVKSLGGGGHSYAAGFQQEGNIEEVLKKVLNLIE